MGIAHDTGERFPGACLVSSLHPLYVKSCEYNPGGNKMSFLSDVATLIKAGYSKEDVKELYALEKQSEPGVSPLPGEPAGEPSKEVQPPTEPKQPAEQPAETAPKASAQPADEPDYKALYEAEQEKVKTLQNKNNQADLSNNVTVTEKDLIDLVRDYC